MVDKEDLFLKIKVNHNGESKEFRSENLPTLDELKSKIMGYLSIPDIKKYMHFSYQNKEGQNKNIEKEVDLFNLSELNQVSNEYYIELYLSIDNELNKIKQFMNSSEFNSKNNSIINTGNNSQKLNEKAKKNESEMKSIEETKRLKIEELQNQINEIKKRREQKKKEKEMNNKFCKYFENIIKYKKELDDLKIINFINEIQNNINNNIMPLIESNISNNLKNKNKKFDKFAIKAEDLINKLETNINNNYNIINDIYIIQNDENMRKLKNNFEEIYKDIINIKNEINNINKIKSKIESKEIQNNNQNKNYKKRNIYLNNAKDYYIKEYKIGKDKKIQLKKYTKVKNENLSLINSDQKNKIIDDFIIFLEKILFDQLKDLSNDDIEKMKHFFCELKYLEIEPLPIIKKYLDENISIFDKDIALKNEKEEKFRNINYLISNLEKEYDNNNSKKKKISHKDSLNKNEPKK